MEQQRITSSLAYREENALSGAGEVPGEIMDLTQIQKLVHLLDRSDISEIELKRAAEGLHLVLRKLKTPDHFAQTSEVQPVEASKHAALADRPDQPMTVPDHHCLKAQMVGVFHPRLNPHGKILVAANDFVKVGQVVGTIEALNLLNEITTSVAGRVTEISVQDGQPVEFGQILMTIDSSGQENVPSRRV